MTEEVLSCVEPVKPSKASQGDGRPQEQTMTVEVQEMTVARVGTQAPDFSAQAYYAGGFKRVSLSDYAGKWTVLCFYPGDFTFV